MLVVLGISAVATTAALLLMMASGALQRRTDLLSFRNFFLLGFCFFYGLATFFLAFMDPGGFIYSPNGSGYLPLAICTPLFAAIFLLGDRWGHRFDLAQRLVPKLSIVPTTASLFFGIGLCLLLAVLGLFPLGDYFTALLAQVRPGLASCAAGLATYYLISKKFNPIAWALFLGVFVLSLLICVTGGIDRRYSLSVFLVVGWVWYFTDLRYKNIGFTLSKLAIGGAVVAMFLVVYSGIRGVGEEQRSFTARAELLRDAARNPTEVKKGALESVLFQDAPINTIYIMENYPLNQSLDPFNGLIFFATNPIPRTMWENKPLGLGYSLQMQFGIEANLGPGIIGHGWSEGMWLGVIGYALIFGLISGVLDRATATNATNPFFLSVYGAEMGNYVGLPRGETSLFLVICFSGAVACIIVLGLMNLVGKTTFQALPLVMPDSVRRLMQSQAQAQAQGDAQDQQFDGQTRDDYGLQEDHDTLQDPEVAAAYGQEPQQY